MADIFSIAKAIKEYLLDQPELSTETIWLMNYPAVETVGILISVTHNAQDENFERIPVTIDVAVKGKKENIKSIYTKLESIESFIIGNMIDISDGAGKTYRILRLLPFGDRATEFSDDKINIYHYRVYQAILVLIEELEDVPDPDGR